MQNPWQRQWAEAWNAFTPSSTDTNPWRAALDSWWRSFDPKESQPTDLVEKFIAQGRAFFEMGERLAKSAADSQDAFDWTSANDNMFGGLKRMFDFAPGVGNPTNPGFWQLPIDNWQRTMSSLSAGVPGDYLRGFSPSGSFTDSAEAKVKQFLSTPGVGYSREFQSQYQRLAQLVLAYEKAYQRYVAACMDMGKRSVEMLQKQLQERGGNNQPVTSVRELYNLWVECSEQVYGETVMTDDYVEVHGGLVNALMALKRHGSRMMDDLAGAYNLPTRGEVDTVHHRLQEVRRENKMLQQNLVELSEQLEALRARIAQPAKQAPRKRKSAKKTTKGRHSGGSK